MSVITLLAVAVVATGLLVAGVRAIMTRALEHDPSFRTDLDAALEVPVPHASRESA